MQHKVLLLHVKMNKQTEDIKAIREMMEKSSKFLSLSGLSGVLAGITAILGAGFAYFYILPDPSLMDCVSKGKIFMLLADALITLFISIGFVFYFSYRKAQKNKQKLFSKVALRTLYNFAIPLLCGGVFCLVHLLRGNVEIAMSASLLFYGLALVNVSKYTFEEVHSLGIVEITLGLAAVILSFPYAGILFWTIGFGVCHIIYGSMMYVKYDIKPQKNEKEF